MLCCADFLVTSPVEENASNRPTGHSADHQWTFFIGDLTKDVEPQEVLDMFSAYGTVEDVILKPPTGNSALRVSAMVLEALLSVNAPSI